jgi:hypothetical protein
VIEPLFVLDSKESWWPVGVEESLAPFGYRWEEGGWTRSGSHIETINLPPELTQPDLPCVGYRRSAKAGGLVWWQFWLWWLYNPKKYAGHGDHEGDWEMVQIGCADEQGERPILMTCSQHSGGEKREFWRVMLEDKRPVVYVARDSHANYFAPERDVTDVADGNGKRLKVQWREFEGWQSWMGKWGNSRNSPGPLSSRRVWNAPHAWHGQARG